tara:strand:+ start:196181 stop:196330 length:150 start_codon:yes stop_codon:yes gene_type:complete
LDTASGNLISKPVPSRLSALDWQAATLQPEFMACLENFTQSAKSLDSLT